VRPGVLAARGDSLSTGMNPWVQQASGAYVNFGVTDNLALRGHVVAEYPADSGQRAGDPHHASVSGAKAAGADQPEGQ
jgi:hypothetical protein